VKKKLSPKRQAELSHKLVILAELMINTLDELDYSEIPLANALKIVSEKSCEILDEVYKTDSVSSSTYVTELSSKVDTVIRKNFERKI
jgi:hypothetical protein